MHRAIKPQAVWPAPYTIHLRRRILMNVKLAKPTTTAAARQRCICRNITVGGYALGSMPDRYALRYISVATTSRACTA